MMNKIIIAALSAAVVSALVPTAFAKGPVAAPTCVPAASTVMTPEDRAVLAQGEFFDGRYNLGVLQRRLRLTGQQKRQMQSLYTSFEDRTKDSRSKFVSLLNEKKDQLRSGKIDEKKLADLDDQIVKLRSNIFRDRLQLVRDRLALLTPDQTRRLAQLKERMVCHAASTKVHRKRAKVSI